MKERNVFVSSVFEKSIKRLVKRFRNVRNIYQNFLSELKEGEIIGEEIQGHQDFFKARYPNPVAKRGKSGGFRIIYRRFLEENLIVLLDIYSKTDRENVNWERVDQAIEEVKDGGL